MRVQVNFTNGTTLFGHLVTEWPTLGDVINDDRLFIKFRRPNGQVVFLNKNSIAYIVEAPDDLY
jgi:small nuclear ribonucleoprotein (snRNP)-like protein